MNKTLIRVIRDQEGKIISGLSVYLCKKGETPPSGTCIPAVEDPNLPGKYVWTITDMAITNKYDIYIVGGQFNPYETDIDLGWNWKFSNVPINGSGDTVIDLSTLTDDYGNIIPTDTLPMGVNYETIITSTSTDRFVYIKSTASSGRIITFSCSTAGASDIVKVNLYVVVKGE